MRISIRWPNGKELDIEVNSSDLDVMGLPGDPDSLSGVSSVAGLILDTLKKTLTVMEESKEKA